MSNKLNLRYIELFVLIILCTFAIGLTNSKYSSTVSAEENINIAKPIVELEPTSEITVENILPGQTATYTFNIKNNVENTDGTLTKNDILMNYYVKVIYNDSNLPLTYEIYDTTTGEDVKLNTTSNQTDINTRGYKEIENHSYKIIFTWPADANDVSYANKDTSFNIDVNAEQAV